MGKVILNHLKNEVEECVKLCNYIKKKLDLNYSGDVWIARNMDFLLERYKGFIGFIEAFDILTLFDHLTVSHPLNEKMVLIAQGWNDTYVSEEIRFWRRNLSDHSYERIPIELRKEVFDYFFRNDLYG